MPGALEGFVADIVALAVAEDGTTARRLPPERDLVEALGISRGALREHLLVLERLGFLTRVQGRGTYLDTPRDDFVRSYFTISREFGHLTDEQFAESRMMLEETAAGAAAERASADRRLQLAVENPVMHLLHEGLSHVLSETIRVRRLEAVAVEIPDADGTLRTDSVHYPIVDAIETGDPAAARAAMREHFRNWQNLGLASDH